MSIVVPVGLTEEAAIRTAILEAFPFYRDSPGVVRESMDAAMQYQVLPAGTFFYREWDVCPHFAVVISGDIRVYKTGGMGREVTLYHVQDSEPCLVNLISVLLSRPAMATAVTEVETSAVLFPGASLGSWMAASEALRLFVFESIAARVVNVMTLVEEVAFQHMDSRLGALLLKRFGTRQSFSATHEEIAAELGTAREVVSRVLRDFAQRGAIRVTRGSIELLSAETLLQLM
ncbi:MAG TPA: Crp/Fnr family transcriptional regulator [Usitatibacter sp.]|nr:Crp/Fnr family transcriptional regulator [Usitatibacter sp.]